MPDITRELEVAEIKGCCWISVLWKMLVVFIKLLHITNKNMRSYPKASNPYSKKTAYLGVTIRLALKEEE